MDDESFLEDSLAASRNFWNRLPPGIRAALLFALPFIAVDIFNYFSVGAALVISLPILAIMYVGCGAVACWFAGDRARTPSEGLFVGSTAGLALWLTSTVVNTAISLIVGAASVGTTLILGVPYLCLCAPIQLIGGGLAAALGGLLYTLLAGRRPKADDDSWLYD